MNKIPTTFKNISTRGIMTITIILSLMSLPLVQHIYQLKMSERYSYSVNYHGTYGGEIIIPILILFIGIILSLENDRRRYTKYAKNKKF